MYSSFLSHSKPLIIMDFNNQHFLKSLPSDIVEAKMVFEATLGTRLLFKKSAKKPLMQPKTWPKKPHNQYVTKYTLTFPKSFKTISRKLSLYLKPPSAQISSSKRVRLLFLSSAPSLNHTTSGLGVPATTVSKVSVEPRVVVMSAKPAGNVGGSVTIAKVPRFLVAPTRFAAVIS